VSYNNISQSARVLPGSYVLRAWVRTEGVTTNEGPRIEVQDAESAARLNLRSDSFLGTRGWTPIAIPFAVGPATNVIAVRVIRDPSQKFDSKINGTFWIDSLSVTRSSSPTETLSGK
jgi:hypothetical protein